MSTAPQPEKSRSEEPRPEKPRAERSESDWERRKRLADVFGETLPETTRDEREPEPGGGRGSDDWLLSQVPPHHGS
ncbi:hypothetical protein [Nocardioides sp. zg-DK7169]|uniref:hypothetical protein n=1 Tax=Nocardioides sp. zg-DK7169 TaxID=2736600 RepID=UPI0015558F26|nr:hypothetical protein [Nocardioides sp. zg-DK7169]NPC97377.1 hypothetical protein [Nocardioides sp. zg-DK7169]